MIVLDDDCWFVTCFDVLSCDGILSSCHDFQIHTSYSSWFENGLRACIITLIWNLFACFLWNQIKQFLKYDFLNSPALLLKSLFCVLTCEGLFDDQFRKYVFFLKKNIITFEICLHAYLQNTWQEDHLIKETKDPFLHGDFDSMDMFTRVTVENALLCFTAPNTKRDSVTPKMTFEFAFAAQQNDLRTFNQAFLPRKARKESGNSSPVSPGHRSKMAARRWVDRPWSFF